MSALPFNLTDRTALITGGTSGIGLAIAGALLEAGAKVMVGSRSIDKVQHAASKLAAHYPDRVVAQQLDVADYNSFDTALAAAVEKFGRVDILVNCAGVNQKKPTLEVTDEEHRFIMDVNYFGPFHACQQFAQHVKNRGGEASGGGTIINICSVTSFVGLTEVTPYACSKGALLALTRQLAVEWPRLYGIRVNGIAPGFVPADQNRQILKSGDRGRRILENTPMQRFGTPDEIAAAAVYLCSDAGRFINGQCINIDGGFMANGVCEAEQTKGA